MTEVERLRAERDLGVMWLFLEFRSGVPPELAPTVTDAIAEAMERVSGRAMMVLPRHELAAVRSALAEHDRRAADPSHDAGRILASLECRCGLERIGR